MNRTNSLNRSEWRTTGSLALLYALRMLGMFMVLPVLALYVKHLPGGATGFEIGLAIGIYGLLQACLQIPLGTISDRIGRRPVIAAGLLVFAAGSLVAGLTHDTTWLIIGRALQGAGAISSAVSALLADTTRPEVRTKAMTILGAGIGAAVLLALVIGPPVSGLIGVRGIFILTAVLTVAALPVLWLWVPSAPPLPSVPGAFRRALADGQLLRLDAGIFLLQTMMTSLFVATPFVLHDTLGLSTSRQWEVYLPVLVVSIIPVFAVIHRVESAGKVKPAFIGAVSLLTVSLLGCALLQHSGDAFVTALLLFFIGFNFLEGTLPSLISKRAPASGKGAALGVYSTSQFLGIFVGGAVGGVLLGHFGPEGVFLGAASTGIVWLFVAAGLQPPVRDQAANTAEREGVTANGGA